MNKKNVEEELANLLIECLEGSNQESGIKDFHYDEEKQEFHVVFDVVTVPEDNYIGFAGY